MEDGLSTWLSVNRRPLILGGLAVLALLLQFVLEWTRTPEFQRDYDLKLAAAEKAHAAYQAVRRHRLMEGAYVDMVNDPAGTGLIGPESSLITNHRGDHDAKLTSLNPNWAAVMVTLFRRAGLKPGDPIAVALTGSFPGLNIAVFAALETMELSPVVITSVGASQWGANYPDFTWLHMEAFFAKESIFHIRSTAASLGGGDDMGGGLTPAGRDSLFKAIESNDIPLLRSENIEDAITSRMVLFEKQLNGRPCRCYVNVGGGVASLGHSRNRNLIPRGLSMTLRAQNWPRKGCMVLMSDKGVPVIQLLYIEQLALEHGLPLAPDYLAEPGEGDIFVRNSYRMPLVAVFFVVYASLCALVLAPEVRRKFRSPFGFGRRTGGAP
jgi:poly-gamma-glutamate system protein